MGQFDNELNLLSKENLRESFIYAKLLRRNSQFWEEDVKMILQNYVRNQLIHIPGGSKSFDWYLITAKHTLTTMLLNNTLPLHEMPPCLLSRLREDHDIHLKTFIQNQQAKLAETTLLQLQEKNIHNLPELKSLLDPSTELHPNKFSYHTLEESSSQLIPSISEQKAILKLTMDRINIYSSCITEQTKSIILLGGPGVGKTTVLQMIVLQVLQEKRYNVALTALMSERANQL
jgi:predicted NACHT family NTPase